MNDGISVAEACELKAMTADDIARLCQHPTVDWVLYLGVAAGCIAVGLAVLLMYRRRKR